MNSANFDAAVEKTEVTEVTEVTENTIIVIEDNSIIVSAIAKNDIFGSNGRIYTTLIYENQNIKDIETIIKIIKADKGENLDYFDKYGNKFDFSEITIKNVKL
jgi:hypothetical protein